MKAQVCLAGEFHSCRDAQGGSQGSQLCIMSVLLSILHEGKRFPTSAPSLKPGNHPGDKVPEADVQS